MTSGHPRGRLNLQRKDKIPLSFFFFSFVFTSSSWSCSVSTRSGFPHVALSQVDIGLSRSLGVRVCVRRVQGSRHKGLTAKHTKDWVKFSQWVWEGIETLVVGGIWPLLIFFCKFQNLSDFFFLLPFCSVIYPINIVHKKLGVSIWIAFFAVFFCCYLPVKYNSYETWSQHFSFLRRLFLSTCL